MGFMGRRQGAGGLALALVLVLGGCEGLTPGSLRDRDTSPVTAETPSTARGASPTAPDARPAPGTAPGTAAETAEEASARPLPEAELYRGSGQFMDPDAPRREVAEGAGGFTLNFAEAEIREVVDAVLGGALGENYTIHPEVSGTITARTSRPLSRARVIPALEDILAMNGAALIRERGLYKVVPLDQAGSVPTVANEAQRAGAGFGLHLIPLDFVGAETVQQTLSRFVAPGRRLYADGERNLLIFQGPGREARDLVEMVRIFDVDWLAGMSFALLPLELADPETIVTELRAVFGEDTGGPGGEVVRFLPVTRMSAILVISEQPRYLDRARTWTRRLDRGVAGDQRRLFVYRVENGRAQDLANVLGAVFDVRTVNTGQQDRDGEVAPGREAARLTSDGEGDGDGDGTGGQSGTGGSGRGTDSDSGGGTRPGESAGAEFGQAGAGAEGARAGASGGGPFGGGGALGGGGEGDGPRIIADARNNALLILATGREYRMIESTLRKLDLVPLQVLIEATIAEITLNDALNYGVRFFFQGSESGLGEASASFSDLSSGGIVSSFPGFSFLFEGADARVALNALEEITDVNVVSSPQLMVLDNETARLNVGDQVPVATQSSVATGDADAPIVNSIELRDTGVILEITPRVNSSGLVVLDVRQEVSDVTQTTSSELNSPTIEQRSITTSVAVQTGETIALGGLIRDSREDSRSGVPFLQDIPILGNLFQSRALAADRTELLILLSPRVVRNPDEARAVTRELRRRVQGLEDVQERIGRSHDSSAPADAPAEAPSPDSP
mgnify:CR=1 FL=1